MNNLFLLAATAIDLADTDDAGQAEDLAAKVS
jgi:hypothetical protein